MNDCLRLEHVGITVADMDRALDFLTMLGFETKARFAPFDPGAVAGITRLAGARVRQLAYVVRDDCRFELLEYEAPDRADDMRRPCDAGYFHIALEVDDIEATKLRLGCDAPSYTVSCGPAVGQRAAYVYGPDGLTVELIQKARSV